MRILNVIVAAAFLFGASASIPDKALAQAGTEAMSKPGVHLVLFLDLAEARASWLTSMRDDIRTRLREAKIGFATPTIADNVVQVRLSTPEDADAAMKALADLAPAAAPSGMIERLLGPLLGPPPASEVVVAKGEGGIITVMPTEAGLERHVSGALDSALAIARQRLDGMAVTATAVRRGSDRIYVHASDLQDAATLKELLTKPAELGFHEVHATMSVEEARRGLMPPGYKIYPAPPEEMLLRQVPILRGNNLVDAQVAMDAVTSQPVISFRFNNFGTRAFGKFTADNVGRPIAIVLDGMVLSAPVIREPILGGSGQVSGNFTIKEAMQMAVQLRAGPLPAKLAVVEERVVPPGR